MEHENTNIESPEERYCEVLKAYYDRLKQERNSDPSTNAIGEVKLRLFLSLLDQAKESHDSGRLNGSPL